MREVNLKRNWAGDVRSEPLKETSASIRSGQVGKIIRLGRIIPLLGVKNQMKFGQKTVPPSKGWHLGDLSDDTANPRLLSIGYKYPKTPLASSHPPKAARRKRLVDILQCLPYFLLFPSANPLNNHSTGF
jgi:hypothetical protein